MIPKAMLLCTLLAVSLLFHVCDNSTPLVTGVVTITYHQAGNFNRWQLLDQSGEINDGEFMRYRIISIKNTNTNATLFHFDPNKISAASDPNDKPAPFIFLSGVLPFDVRAGETVTNPGGLTIRVKGNPAELATQVEFLNYASSEGEHVLMVNDNPSAQAVPHFDPLTKTGI